MADDFFERIRATLPGRTLTDPATSEVRLTRAEREKLQRAFGEQGVDVSKPFKSDRELLIAWTQTSSDEDCDRLPAVWKAAGVFSDARS